MEYSTDDIPTDRSSLVLLLQHPVAAGIMRDRTAVPTAALHLAITTLQKLMA
jgi:hypothetical protein